jgi:hypothetical protein
MKKVLKILNKFLLYGFFVLGIILLFQGTGRISTMIIAFISFFSSILSSWIFKLKQIDEKYLLFINILLWLNLAGELYIYYFSPLPFDKVLHISAGFFLAAIVYHYYLQNSTLKKDAIFLTVLGMLGLWEIYEYTMDTFFSFQLQGVITNGVWIQSQINDTMMDLIWGSIGALIYLIFKKEKINESIKRGIKKVNKIKIKKIDLLTALTDSIKGK